MLQEDEALVTGGRCLAATLNVQVSASRPTQARPKETVPREWDQDGFCGSPWTLRVKEVSEGLQDGVKRRLSEEQTAVFILLEMCKRFADGILLHILYL